MLGSLGRRLAASALSRRRGRGPGQAPRSQIETPTRKARGSHLSGSSWWPLWAPPSPPRASKGVGEGAGSREPNLDGPSDLAWLPTDSAGPALVAQSAERQPGAPFPADRGRLGARPRPATGLGSSARRKMNDGGRGWPLRASERSAAGRRVWGGRAPTSAAAPARTRGHLEARPLPRPVAGSGRALRTFPPRGRDAAGQTSGAEGRGALPRAPARPRPSDPVTQPRGCRGTGSGGVGGWGRPPSSAP